MKWINWGIAGSAGVALALLTVSGQVGLSAWPVVMLLIVGAVGHVTQPQLAMLLYAIAGTVSLGAIARDNLAIGLASALIALVLVASTGIAWRRQWRQMRRDIVHRAIDEQLVPFDLSCPLDVPRPRKLRLNSARPLPPNQPTDAPEPIDVPRRRV